MTQSLNRSILELAAVLFGPALDDNFFVGIELNSIPPLAVQIAEETVLPSAEREISHGRGHADVDTNIARRRLIAETARSRSTRGKQRRLVTVGAALEERQGVVQTLGVYQAQYGPKDFGVGDFAGRRHIIKNRRLHEIAGFVFWNSRVAAIQQNLGSLLLSDTD